MTVVKPFLIYLQYTRSAVRVKKTLIIAISQIAVALDNYSKKWYNMSQGDEKNGQNAAQCGVESSC